MKNDSVPSCAPYKAESTLPPPQVNSCSLNAFTVCCLTSLGSEEWNSGGLYIWCNSCLSDASIAPSFAGWCEIQCGELPAGSLPVMQESHDSHPPLLYPPPPFPLFHYLPH